MTSAIDYGEQTRKAIDLIMARKDGAMTDNRTTELLNCPFCGGEAELHPTYDMDAGNIDGWFAWCVNDTCECKPETGQFFTEAEAIAAWNARTPIEYDGWFYLPKPKERIIVYGEPEITRTENGYKVKSSADVVDDAVRKWGEELGEYAMQRICEIWNSRAERTCEMETSWEIRDELGITDAPEDTWGYMCSKCGDSFRYDRGIKPNYCPSCGRKVTA